MRIDTRGDDAGGNFFAGFEGHAGGSPVFDENLVDRGLRADFHPEFTSGCSNGIADGPGAPTAEAPGAEGAVDFTHVVMQENVSGAGRADAEEGADDSGGRHGGFEHVGFKPLVEKSGGAHGHELDEGVALVGGEIAKKLAEKIKTLKGARAQRGGV